MASHKAAFDAGEVERLVILVVVILGAEVLIPVAGHILLEESYKVFEEFEAVLSQFIAELATSDDNTPVGVVAHALAVLPGADIVLFATSFSLFFRKVISLPYSFSGFFLGRPLLVSFLSIVCLFSIL